MIMFEGVHPLEGGALRLKFRRDRRTSRANRINCLILSIAERQRDKSKR
jgi:hypothetical protein